MHMSIMSIVMNQGWSDEDILKELGARLRRERLNRNLTQQELADQAGISRGSIAKLEGGSNSSLKTLVRTLRALGIVSRLDVALSEPEVSPLQLAATRGRSRRRASGRRAHRE